MKKPKPYARFCRPAGHPKGKGRCKICRRLSDKARNIKPERVESINKRVSAFRKSIRYKIWYEAWYKEFRARPEVLKRCAFRQRLYRRGLTVEKLAGKPKEVAAKLLAKAEAKLKQERYGIIQIGNYNN